jgi:hypothetical protein
MLFRIQGDGLIDHFEHRFLFTHRRWRLNFSPPAGWQSSVAAGEGGASVSAGAAARNQRTQQGDNHKQPMFVFIFISSWVGKGILSRGLRPLEV